MRVVLVVSANKYTGAGAVAEHLCRSLRTQGVAASLLFVRGRNLERRLTGLEWALPCLVKERHPGHLVANLARLREASRNADVMISHLPHDHLMCVLAGAHRRVLLVQNMRNPRHLRADPLHRAVTRRAHALLLATTTMAPRGARHATPALALPVPLEDRFHPQHDGTAWRARLGIPASAPVIGMVGKLAAGRGFDCLLQTAARVEAPIHVVVVGHGEAQGQLEHLACELGLDRRVHWAGYQDEALPELYAAMDVVLFTAPGSDHGHRAISEAQGCGRPVVAAAIPGVEDLIADGRTGRIVAAHPEALAAAVTDLLKDRRLAETLAQQASTAVAPRRFAAVGKPLHGFLEHALRARNGAGK